MTEKNNYKISGYDIDPIFGRHNPRKSPLGQAATLLKKIHVAHEIASNNKPQQKS